MTANTLKLTKGTFRNQRRSPWSPTVSLGVSRCGRRLRRARGGCGASLGAFDGSRWGWIRERDSEETRGASEMFWEDLAREYLRQPV